ncbi:hypothetical protein THICB1_150002 [Thiomonas arsenitoxydans]|uniref:Helix-turn-helix domain-containing protein n=1 Tax=Thiomonas arsenitoxydans (strain DSM 22701 / CIP 110005 / 3As) TaxID=426114 RepID=A0ABP1Z0X8_THIA3|nr:hypothetical protein [Thiomonas arsenitoxydans]CQR30361.1 hypothetical protein THICB1_150002 [Thiomonas arsenitoxydans]
MTAPKASSISPFVAVTKEAAAAALSCSLRWIDKLIEAGELPVPTKIGRRAYWHPDEFYGALSAKLLRETNAPRFSVNEVDHADTPSQPIEPTVDGRRARAATATKLSVSDAKGPPHRRRSASPVDAMRAKTAAVLRVVATP